MAAFVAWKSSRVELDPELLAVRRRIASLEPPQQPSCQYHRRPRRHHPRPGRGPHAPTVR